MKTIPPKSEILKMITPEMITAASLVLMAKAWIQTVKPIVEKYSNEILAKHQFTNKREVEMLSKRFNIEERVILDMEEVYQLSDEDMNVFHQECKVARDAAGLKVSNPEFCPLLVAQSDLNKAEHVFIDAMEPITGVNSDTHGLICSVEKHKKMVELCLGLLGSLDLLKNPLAEANA